MPASNPSIEKRVPSFSGRRHPFSFIASRPILCSRADGGSDGNVAVYRNAAQRANASAPKHALGKKAHAGNRKRKKKDGPGVIRGHRSMGYFARNN
jgi:hypothetical protein